MNTSTQEKNFNLIRLINEVHKYWEENKSAQRLKCLPPQKYLAEKTGLNIRTIKRHYKNIKTAFNIKD